MPVEQQNGRVIRFGVFEADLLARELRKRGVRVRLQEQPFRLLQALLERPGQIVTREEIKDKLWPDDTFVDFDKSLNTAAQKLRQALGDSAESPRFVDTVPRVGYRFVAPVEAAGSAEEPSTIGAAAHPTHSVRHTTRVLLPWALVAILALALVRSWSISPPGSELRPSVRRFDLLPERTGARASRAGVARSAISPDGSRIAYLSAEDPRRVWLHDLSRAESGVIEGTEGARGLFWSPDSRSLAFYTFTSLKRIDLRRGGVTTVHSPGGSDARFLGGAWSRDGEKIFFSIGTGGGTRLFEASLVGGEPRPVLENEVLGRRFTVVPGRDSALVVEAGGDLFLVQVSTGERQLLAADARNPSWSPTGHVVFDSGGSIWALPFSQQELKATGEVFLVEQGFVNGGVSTDGALLGASTQTSPAGYRLSIRSREGLLLGTVGPPLYGGPFGPASPAVSPDGSRVAVAASLQPDRPSDIWLFEFEGQGRRRLTTGPTGDLTPVWLPDGKKILFRATHGGGTSLQGDADYFLVDVSGSGAIESVFDDDGRVAEATFSPDGRTLVFQRRELTASNYDLSSLQLPDAGPSNEFVPWLDSEFNEVHPQFSPDGRYVAYASGQSGSQQVHVRPFPGGSPAWQVSTEGGSAPRWSPGGRELYWWGGGQEGYSLMVAEVDFSRANPIGERQALFLTHRGAGVHLYDVLPDGRFLVVEPIPEGDAGEEEPVVLRVTENWAVEAEE